MSLLAVITMLMLLEYFIFGALVGRARHKTGIKAPATSGDPVFERYFRVHQNTLEQLLITVPALWIFGQFVSVPIAALLGLAFIVGRAIYCWGYVKAPERRSAGFLIGMLAQLVLLIGGLIGAGIAAFM